MSLKFDSSKKLRKEKTKHKVESWEEYEQREEVFVKERLQAKEPTISAQVRITGGKAKNFHIDIPRTTRPLTDRMKVRIFDLLREDVYKKTVFSMLLQFLKALLAQYLLYPLHEDLYTYLQIRYLLLQRN